MEPLKTKATIIPDCDQEDFTAALATAETLVQVFEARKNVTFNGESKKDSISGYAMENQFYGQNALNAVRALDHFSAVAFDCGEDVPLETRLAALSFCKEKLITIDTLSMRFTQESLAEGEMYYRVANIGEVLAASTQAIQKTRTRQRKLQA